MVTSKYSNTMYNRYKRVESSLKDLNSQTISFRLSLDTYLQMRNEKVYNADYSKLNQYYRGKIAGLSDAFFNELYRYHLIFCYTFNGKVLKDYSKFMTASELTTHVKNEVSRGDHYWKVSITEDVTPTEKARVW